jgi:phosphoribosylamine--glycine ligase
MKNVMVVDYSGRGHAFADLFVRTNPDVTLHYVPGCGAIDEDRIVSCPQFGLADPGPMVAYAQQIGADLVTVTNPTALANGFVDAFREAGLRTIGPDRSAARLESSKIFTKELCAKYGIPTASYRTFDDAAAAIAYVREVGAPVVVKADGLCFGNGAFVCDTEAEAVAAIERLLVTRDFGAAGDVILIEEKIIGSEQLYFALVSGGRHVMLPAAVDYPRTGDGNTDVMCGGMGAFSPSPLETAEDNARFEEQILLPLLAAIEAEGLDYSGIIYLGCFLVGEKLYLIEINARMGDPEAEVVLPRITSDFVEVCTAVLDRRLGDLGPLSLSDDVYVDVVATQGPTGEGFPGWPYGAYRRGNPIDGLTKIDPRDCRVFFGAARQTHEGHLVTDGGKVLHLVGRGASLAEAAENAYRGIAEIDFDGIRYRTDIGRLMPWE